MVDLAAGCPAARFGPDAAAALDGDAGATRMRMSGACVGSADVWSYRWGLGDSMSTGFRGGGAASRAGWGMQGAAGDAGDGAGGAWRGGEYGGEPRRR